MSRIAEDGEDISNDELWYDVEVVDVTGCREIYHVPPLLSSSTVCPIDLYSNLSIPHLTCPLPVSKKKTRHS